jgi:hypothetical protein
LALLKLLLLERWRSSAFVFLLFILVQLLVQWAEIAAPTREAGQNLKGGEKGNLYYILVGNFWHS